MLELFKRMWVAWNDRVVRNINTVLSAVLMGVAYFVGLGPVAIGFRLSGRPLLDRAPGVPGAATYWVPRDGKPIEMQQATRQF